VDVVEAYRESAAVELIETRQCAAIDLGAVLVRQAAIVFKVRVLIGISGHERVRDRDRPDGTLVLEGVGLERLHLHVLADGPHHRTARLREREVRKSGARSDDKAQTNSRSITHVTSWVLIATRP